MLSSSLIPLLLLALPPPLLPYSLFCCWLYRRRFFIFPLLLLALPPPLLHIPLLLLALPTASSLIPSSAAGSAAAASSLFPLLLLALRLFPYSLFCAPPLLLLLALPPLLLRRFVPLHFQTLQILPAFLQFAAGGFQFFDVQNTFSDFSATAIDKSNTWRRV